MTIHRFFIPEIQSADNILVLPQETSYQIAKVLRLQRGDIIVVFDKTQTEYTLMLEDVQKQEVRGRVIKQEKNHAEPSVEIHLYQSLLPREKFEEVLDKGTQIGVSLFIPVETARTIVKAKDVKDEKLSRWQKITQEAAEQSERGIVPKIHQPMSFRNAIEQASKNGIVLIAWEEETKNFPTTVLANIRSVILGSEARHFEKVSPLVGNPESNEGSDSGQARMTTGKTISLFIGPEGGFTQEEANFAKEKNVQTISLGPRILKSETAGIVLSSLVLFSVGDLDRI